MTLFKQPAQCVDHLDTHARTHTCIQSNTQCKEFLRGGDGGRTFKHFKSTSFSSEGIKTLEWYFELLEAIQPFLSADGTRHFFLNGTNPESPLPAPHLIFLSLSLLFHNCALSVWKILGRDPD